MPGGQTGEQSRDSSASSRCRLSALPSPPPPAGGRMPPAPSAEPPRLWRLLAEEPTSVMKTWRLVASRFWEISLVPRGPLILLEAWHASETQSRGGHGPGLRLWSARHPPDARVGRAHLRAPGCSHATPQLQQAAHRATRTLLEPRWKSPPTVPGGEAGTRLLLS